jgi:type I restriction enzyme S subunit
MSLDLHKSIWKRVRLGDVIRRSRTQVDPLSSGVERYVAGGHVDSEGVTIERWGHVNDGQMGSTFRYVFGPGQVLFVSARPYLRKVGVPNFSGVVADKTYVLDAEPENGLLSEFLPFVLSSEVFVQYATAEATGSMNPRLLWGPMQRYEFGLPPLDEQKRLADLLWAIERERQASVALAAAAASILSVTADRLLSAVGEVHGVKLLIDLVREPITDGVREKGVDVEGGVPYIRVSDMTQPQLDRGGMLRMSRELAAANKSSTMRAGDLVMALRSKIGLCHVISNELDECNIAQGVGKIAPDFAKVSAEYLYEVLMAHRTQAFLDRLAKGTTIREVALKALRSFSIPVPPTHDEQQRIVSTLGRIRSGLSASDLRIAAAAALASSVSASIFGDAE